MKKVMATGVRNLALILMILIYVMNAGLAQSPVVVVNQPQQRDLLLNGVADPSGAYFLGGYVNTMPSYATLLRVKANGDTLFRRFPQYPDSRIDGLISADDGTFLAYGDLPVDTLPPLMQYRHHLWILQLDTGLNILHENMYAMPAQYIGNMFMNGIREINGNIVLCALALGDFSDPQHLCDYVMMRLQPNGDSVKVRYIDTGFNDINVSLFASNDEDSLFLCGHIGQAVGTTQGVHYLDHEFNYLGSQSNFFGPFFAPLTVKRWNSQRVLLSGIRITDIPTGWVMKGAGSMNNDAEVTDDMVCAPTSWYCNDAFRQGMDFAGGNRVFVGGNKDMHIPGNCYDHTAYYLSVLDSGLQQQSHWFFGGDMYYQLNAVIASPNGGCMLAGIRSPEPDAGLTNAYLVMLGADMLMATEAEIPLKPNVVISPNPGHASVQIYTGNKGAYEIMFFDIIGNCVLHEKGETGLSSFGTLSLPSGLYAYRLVFDDGITICGKWIKQ